jgi:putative addiction module component (TIGR02574 family)
MEREQSQPQGSVDCEAAPLSEAQKAELDRRLATADTATARPWPEVRAELTKGR